MAKLVRSKEFNQRANQIVDQAKGETTEQDIYKGKKAAETGGRKIKND
jgi:hypothetical protein